MSFAQWEATFKTKNNRKQKCLRVSKTHSGDISGPELNGAKQAKDDDDDVQEVGQDGSPLVAQEIDHLTLQHTDLQKHKVVEGEVSDMETIKQSSW